MPPTPAHKRRDAASMVQGAILPISLVMLWEFAVRRQWLPESLIAPPSAVLLAFGDMVTGGTLWTHIVVSLARLVSGFFVGALVGVVYGVGIGVSKTWERVWMPTFLLLAPVPIIAWIPLLIVLFGIDGARFGLVALGTFFIVLFGAIDGVRGVDNELVDMARMYGKRRAELIRHVLWPSALPSVMHSLRTALAMAWVLLIMAEIIASSKGLGWLLWDARNFGRSDDMIVAMIAIGLLGKFADALLMMLNRRLLWWRHSFAGQ